jgi:hypothetical protein
MNDRPAIPQPLLLTARQAAARLNISERLLWSWTSPRGPIRVVRFGRVLRYDERDLDAVIEAQKAGS